MEILFPAMSERAACENLHRTIYAARRALQPELPSYPRSQYLLIRGRQISLSVGEGLRIDAEEFEAKARHGLKLNEIDSLHAAVAIYAGDLLTEEPYEEWISTERERLRSVYHSVLWRIAHLSEEGGKLDDAHHWLDEILKLEPADERAHRAKMRLYKRQGDRLMALKQYSRCEDALKRELSVAPQKETETLRQDIQNT